MGVVVDFLKIEACCFSKGLADKLIYAAHLLFDSKYLCKENSSNSGISIY
jgi:hypothetical protein